MFQDPTCRRPLLPNSHHEYFVGRVIRSTGRAELGTGSVAVTCQIEGGDHGGCCVG